MFTDRTYILARINTLLAPPEGEPNGPRILHLHGVAGVGKTAIREHLTETLLPNWDLFNLRLAVLDLDTVSKGSLEPDRVFWSMRRAFNRAGIATPLFDSLYLIEWIENRPSEQPPNLGSLLPPFLDTNTQTLEVTAGLIGGDGTLRSQLVNELQQAITEFKVVGLTFRLIRAVQKHYETYNLLRFIGTLPQKQPRETRFTLMPRCLAEDLKRYLEKNSNAQICILIDGFERIQTKIPAHDLQHQIQLLFRYLLSETPSLDRVSGILLGREPLEWNSLYPFPISPASSRGAPRTKVKWNTFIRQERLEGFGEKHAREFLSDSARLRSGEQEALPELIGQYQDAILKISNEDQVEESTSHLPFALSIAVEFLIRSGNDINPLWFEVESTEKMLNRFLRYLEHSHRGELQALQVLALCITFDNDLFSTLVERGFIASYGVQDFGILVSPKLSYVQSTPDGRFRFHRHMQDALIASIGVDGHASAKQVLNWLIEHYLTMCKPDVPNIFTGKEQIALDNLSSILLRHIRRMPPHDGESVLPYETARAASDRLNEFWSPAYSSHATIHLRRRLFALGLIELSFLRKTGADKDSINRARFDLARLLCDLGNSYSCVSTGNLANNNRLAIRVLKAAVSVFRQMSLRVQTSFALRSLVLAYLNTGSHPRQETLFELLHEAEGLLDPAENQSDWASVQHCFGSVHYKISSGDREADLRTAISHFEKVLKHRHPDKDVQAWAGALSNIASCYNALAACGSTAFRKRAVDCFERALIHVPSDKYPDLNAVLHMNLGITFSGFNDADSDAIAKIEFSKALNGSPLDARPLRHSTVLKNWAKVLARGTDDELETAIRYQSEASRILATLGKSDL